MATTAISRQIPFVGVIGGEDSTGCARLVGRELVKHGCAVLTGGSPNGSCTNTENAAILGALDAEQHGEGIARFIGFMPNITKHSFSIEYLTPRQIIVHTGLSSLDSDPINGTTPDILVCFDGGPGTICELAFGIAVGHEVIFHQNCAQNLYDKCTGSRRNEIEKIVAEVAAKWQTHLQLLETNSEAMFNMLIDYLRNAANRLPLTSAKEIVQVVLQSLPKQLSIIPPFPGVLDSLLKQKQQDEFATCWTALSNDAVHQTSKSASTT